MAAYEKLTGREANVRRLAPVAAAVIAIFAFLGFVAILLLFARRIPPPPNLPQAKDIIDLLSVLEDKTTGNLTTEEQAVLRDMLYALRMKYVSLAAK